MRIVLNCGWKKGVNGAYVILNADGTVHIDGFYSYTEAKEYLALCQNTVK